MSEGERICKTGTWCGFTVVERDLGELVRCESCRHMDETPEGGMPVCGKLRKRVPRDGYCHLGERKGGVR